MHASLGGAEQIVVSIVTPMYNEADGIGAFLTELRDELEATGFAYEVILVDDGSADTSVDVALENAWPRMRLLALDRNVGHQTAIEAGLSMAQGLWIVTMDSDGQHPPAEIPRLIAVAEQDGAKVVYARQRERRTDSRSKRLYAGTYYSMVRAFAGVSVPNSQADFRLISAEVLRDIRNVPGDKVLRLLLPAVGYRSSSIEYDVRDRLAGRGRFGFRRQISLAVASILSFSARPLRLIAGLGLVLSLGAFAWLVYVFVAYVATRAVVGWSSVMAAVLVVGGLTLLSVSIVGEYVARIHELVRRHPRYSARWVGPTDAPHLDT